jgi:hypothetical protein
MRVFMIVFSLGIAGVFGWIVARLASARVRAEFAVLAFTLALFPIGLAGQSTWDRYKPGSIAAVIEHERDGVLVQFRLASGHHTVISADAFPTRATVQFLDSSRATPPERLAVLEAWTKSLRISIEPRSTFATELLFREDSLEFWLPVQSVLIPSFHNELRPGDVATLFVGYVGAEGQGTAIDWILVVNEFAKR